MGHRPDAQCQPKTRHACSATSPTQITAVNFKHPALQAAAAALVLFLPGTGCSPNPSGPSAAIGSPAAAPAQGMVWRVSGGKAPFFLAGSFHLLRTGDYPLPASYETAWRESSHLVMEIPPGDAQRPETAANIKNLTLLKSGTLPEYITPTTWQELTQWAKQNPYPVPVLQTMTPWMAGLTVAVATSAQLGFKSEYGIERHFATRLPGSGKTTEGLETTVSQLQLFQQIPALQQEAMLRQALIEARTMAEKADTLANAWRHGDAPVLHATMTESFRDFPEIKKLLLDDRNAAWLPRLEALLQGDQPTMVLVGAGHLCGPGSLINLLQAKGYRCVQMKTETPDQVKKAA